MPRWSDAAKLASVGILPPCQYAKYSKYSNYFQLFLDFRQEKRGTHFIFAVTVVEYICHGAL